MGLLSIKLISKNYKSSISYCGWLLLSCYSNDSCAFFMKLLIQFLKPFSN